MNGKKLSTWAKEQGVHYRTALAWVREGRMPVPVRRTPGGRIRVFDGESLPPISDEHAAKLKGLLQEALDVLGGDS